MQRTFPPGVYRHIRAASSYSEKSVLSLVTEHCRNNGYGGDKDFRERSAIMRATASSEAVICIIRVFASSKQHGMKVDCNLRCPCEPFGPLHPVNST